MKFEKLTLDSIGALRPFFTDNPYRICDCTIGGTFLWRDYHKTEYAIDDGVLYLKVEHPSTAFAPPRGAVTGRKSYERIIEYCGENGVPARICSVSATTLKYILGMFPGSQAQTDRTWSDYLYSSDDIVNLAGRKFSGQRNHINRFMKAHHVWSFESITECNLDVVRSFFEEYAKEHIKDYPAYTEGNVKALEVLDNWELYNQSGGVLYVGGEVVGASIGEVVDDTLYIHIEKANADFHGSYPVLVNQYAKMLVSGPVSYINREEDDGVEGLRTSKMSYHPVSILDKYMVELA